MPKLRQETGPVDGGPSRSGDRGGTRWQELPTFVDAADVVAAGFGSRGRELHAYRAGRGQLI